MFSVNLKRINRDQTNKYKCIPTSDIDVSVPWDAAKSEKLVTHSQLLPRSV